LRILIAIRRDNSPCPMSRKSAAEVIDRHPAGFPRNLILVF
jgi:hypothetical protein